MFKRLHPIDYILNKNNNIKGREIQLIGESIYVNSPQLTQSGTVWRSKKIIKVYERNNLELRYNITYSNNLTDPYISVLRNRTIEYTFSDVGEKLYVYQPEFIGKLQTLQNTVFSLSPNLLTPQFKLEFENPYIRKTLNVVIKNIYLTKRFIFCEFERLSDEITRIFCYDLKIHSGITTTKGFWDDLENTGVFTQLSPINTNEGLFYFLRRNIYSENQNIILYLVQLKNE